MLQTECKQQIAAGQRFEFGRNWQKFLDLLTDERICTAERSLQDNLQVETLQGKTFLDVGCGSGLFSLVARRLGAVVHSFDYDPASVACTAELRRRFFGNDAHWTVEEGSVLDRSYVKPLGAFDVVYSWGVLHHTGAMWQALENAMAVVAPSGVLFIAIYNDQGKFSRRWRRIKRTYNQLPGPLRLPILGYITVQSWGRIFVRDSIQGTPLKTWRTHQGRRGMSPWRDIVDWAGGYPFEVAKPEEVFEYCHCRGFMLEKLRTCGGDSGNNEFVFRRTERA